MSTPPIQRNSAPMGETLGWRELPVVGERPGRAARAQAQRRLIVALMLLCGLALVALAGIAG